VLALGLVFLAATPVAVKATSSKSEVTVGEVFTVELTATGPAGTAFTFVGDAEADAFELRTPATDPQASASPDPNTHRYDAAVYALGDATIPPIPVRYRLPDGTTGEASSEPIVLKVASLLPKDPQQHTLADIRGPEPIGIGRVFWTALVAAVALGAAFVLWIVRRRRKREGPHAPSVPELAPDAEARHALDALVSSGLLQRGEFRGFYIQLTVVAKRYLERRLGAPVLEMTTAETLAFLRAHPHGEALLAVVRDVSDAADCVKFALGQSLVDEAERHLAAVRGLVASLEARLQPRTPDAGEKAA
jgi:hypothetical protein